VPISEVRRKHNSGTIELNSWQKIGKIESEFYERLDLAFRYATNPENIGFRQVKSDNMTIDFLSA
jgi:hypothetical protein